MSRCAFIAVVLAATGSAGAEPVRVMCFDSTYATSSGTNQKTLHAVSQRTIDPAASEIRQRVWVDMDPSRDHLVVYKVDVAAATVTVDDAESGAHGTAKLTGKPWHWSALEGTLAAKAFDVDFKAELSDERFHTTGVMTKDGKQLGMFDVSGTRIDCGKLDEHRAALAKPH
jgi:hypothetical protein